MKFLSGSNSYHLWILSKNHFLRKTYFWFILSIYSLLKFILNPVLPESKNVDKIPGRCQFSVSQNNAQGPFPRKKYVWAFPVSGAFWNLCWFQHFHNLGMLMDFLSSPIARSARFAMNSRNGWCPSFFFLGSHFWTI